jgi:predicted RecB family nuclease
MTTRHDVRTVPLQGGYVAKRCPVRAQNDALLPLEPAPPDPFAERLIARGIAFQAEVVAEILRLHREAVAIEGPDDETRAGMSGVALADGASPILSARLPDDAAGRRVGTPDLLVSAAGGGYRAIDIKSHQTLEVSEGRATEFEGLCAALDSLSLEAAVSDPDLAAKRREDDVLQLAHYQRMLEAAGLAAQGPRYGGIIGTERRVVWYDLDKPAWRTPSSTGKTKLRTTMERYDFEFDFRLDILAVAARHRADPEVQPLVVPVRCTECPSCPWDAHCRSVLEAGAGDVSLLPRIGWAQWKVHRDHGVTDRAALAALDWRTARAVATGMDLAGLRAVAAGRPRDAPVLELGDAWRRARDLERLQEMEISTVGDLLGLDEATAAYSGSELASLPEQIDLARAALGSERVYRHRGVAAVIVPRADIEVDVDMESSEVGVYLWGNLLTDRTRPEGPRSEYLPFVTWAQLTPEGEAANSLSFWQWLMAVCARAHAQGLSFRAYCYNASAENQYLRRLGLTAGLTAEIADFIASAEWVDLLRVWEAQLITGGGSGLKTVAPLVGYHWDVEDAGGTASMVRYDAAAAGDESARKWLLDYNRGDVQATLALREWMASATVPGVRELEPRPGG